MLMIIHSMLSEKSIKEVLKELETVTTQIFLCITDNEILAYAGKGYILLVFHKDHSWYQVIYYKKLALWKTVRDTFWWLI